MATIRLPTNFKEFLKLLNSGDVEYLVVGGYAVAFQGHPPQLFHGKRITGRDDTTQVNLYEYRKIRMSV